MPVESNVYDTPEGITLRKDQDDPLVMYFIIRESLNMGKGKIGAQCAHAAQMIILKYAQLAIHKSTEILDDTEFKKYNITREWLEGSFRKVVLRADDKEFEKVKEQLDCFLVRDGGLTEIAAGSETVLVLWPMKKSERPKTIKRLQILKDEES